MMNMNIIGLPLFLGFIALVLSVFTLRVAAPAVGVLTNWVGGIVVLSALVGVALVRLPMLMAHQRVPVGRACAVLMLIAAEVVVLRFWELGSM